MAVTIFLVVVSVVSSLLATVLLWFAVWNRDGGMLAQSFVFAFIGMGYHLLAVRRLR